MKEWSDHLRDLVELAKIDNREANFNSLFTLIYNKARDGRHTVDTGNVDHYPPDLRSRLHDLGLATELMEIDLTPQEYDFRSIGGVQVYSAAWDERSQKLSESAPKPTKKQYYLKIVW